MKDAKTRRKEKKAKLRAENQKARADAFFIVYYDMGPERSLEKLCEHVAELGIRKSLNTLGRYSVKYNWQQRLIEEDTKRHERELADADSLRSKMIERHSRMGRTLQTLAGGGIATLTDMMKRTEGKLTLEPKDIVSLAKAGTDIELRAAGEPTLRVEVTTVLYNVMIARIAHIFLEVNKLPSPESRAEMFARMVDQAQSHALEEANKMVEQ